MAALHCGFAQHGMLKGTLQVHVVAGISPYSDDDMDEDQEASHKDISDADSESEGGIEDDDEDNVAKALQCDHDVQPACRDHQSMLEDKVSDVKLATQICVSSPVFIISLY
jgi:hypothetical protein